MKKRSRLLAIKKKKRGEKQHHVREGVVRGPLFGPAGEKKGKNIIKLGRIVRVERGTGGKER